MDYRIFHAVDEFSFDYKWLAHATYAFETFGVVVYAAAVLFLWLLTPPGSERRWKIAALCGGVSALISLGINQLIGDFIWHRPRPYESHPAAYHLTQSHDPSFPSDHASAAFGIAFGIYFIDKRVGRIFLVVATLIAAGRVVVGAHYLTDVLASLVISAIVAYLVARFGRPLLLRLAILLERLTDPLVAPFQRRWRARFDSAS
jgi:membrane-associated phospholipid phosphatase